MKMRKAFQRGVARVLILAMANPLYYIPQAHADSDGNNSLAERDTALYAGFEGGKGYGNSSGSGSSGISNPNVLLLLDTSGSMNLPDAWREYPGAYDSHVEYLWNDLSRISTTEVTAENDAAISTSSPSVEAAKDASYLPHSGWGFWGGASLTDRQNLWKGALAYAQGTEPNKAGTGTLARSVYRNYNDASWIYWIPAAASEDTDLRLSSMSWNRFRGANARTQSNYGTLNISESNGFSNNNFAAWNQCNSSLDVLTPSTVLAPTTKPRNLGTFSGQWARWEPYTALSMTKGAIDNYPGLSTPGHPETNNPALWYAKAYLDSSSAPAATAANDPNSRDDYSNAVNNGGADTTALGKAGLPIRYNGGSAVSRWEALKADAGGFVFRAVTDAISDLASMREILSWYGLSSTTDADSNGATDINDARFVAWKGNRDVGATEFGKVTGAGAYFDNGGGACSASTGPYVQSQCLINTIPGTSGYTISKTASCVYGGATTRTDAVYQSFNVGGSCTVSSSGCGSSDLNPSSPPSCADIVPVCSAANAEWRTVIEKDYKNCAVTGASSINVGSCTLSDAALTVGACGSPTGTSAVSIGSCAWSGSATTVAACGWTSPQTTVTVGSCAWSGRSSSWSESQHAYVGSGGTCSAGGVTQYCDAVTTGTYSTAADAKVGGCTNKADYPPGSTMSYGGTCSSTTPSSSNCSLVGGVGRYAGGSTRTVNQTCQNGVPAGTYYAATSCKENGSTSSCEAGGYDASSGKYTTCYNKANGIGNTYNQAGSYGYGGTACAAAANNTCTLANGTSFTVRGSTYTQKVCNASKGAATYYSAGSCSGTAPGCAKTTLASGTTVTSGGTTYYSNRAGCSSSLSGAQSYGGSCKGDSYTITGSPATTTGLTSNCDATTSTFTYGGNTYTQITSCSDKADVTTTCNAKWGAACTTGCNSPSNTSVTVPAGAATVTYYRAYPHGQHTDNLYHDCKADDLATGATTFLNKSAASFNTPWTSAASASGPSYVTSSSNALTADSSLSSKAYSVNWLNWKFGAKVCRKDGQIVTDASKLGSPLAAGITCNPIGRKTRLQIAKDVLYDLVDRLYTEKSPVNVGLMVFNNAASGSATDDLSHGGNLVVPVADVQTTASTLKAKLLTLQATADTPLTETLYEAYQYFLGNKPEFGGGATGPKTGANYDDVKDYNGDPVTKGRYDEGKNRSKYSPPSTGTCGTNAVILISDGAPERDKELDSYFVNNSLAGMSKFTNVISASGKALVGSTYQFARTSNVGETEAYRANAAIAGGEYVYLDELAYFMANANSGNLKVQTATIGFAGVDSEVLKQAHTYDGMKYQEATDGAALASSLAKLFDSLTRWQPMGSSPVVSYNTSAGSSEAVYVSAFEVPTPKVWDGTVKKYTFGFGEETCGKASDNCPNTAVCMTGQATALGNCKKNVEMKYTDTSRGGIEVLKIRDDAASHWIPSSPVDGGEGDKGGTGQMLISSGSPAARKLYTHLNNSGSSALIDLSEANVGSIGSLLGESDVAKQKQIINFARGTDTAGAAAGPWRTWAHYDSVHSRPTEDMLSGSLFYLTSDGVLHAVDRSNGKERWSYMVEEGLPIIKDFMSPDAAAKGNHIEVADGTPVMVRTADKSYVVFGMRRGGRSYYALDVTDIDTPKFAWKISGGGVAGSRFRNMGYTWSTPVVATIRGFKDSGTGKPKPVLIFGGGYDASQDKRKPENDDYGKSVYIVDAENPVTGSLYAEIALGDYSVPGDVLALDTNGDAEATIDRVYVGDMGGGLWRVEVDDRSTTNPTSGWKSLRIAKLYASAESKTPLKLFQRPTMAPVKKTYKTYDTDGNATSNTQVFDAVFIGGGDTQRPFSNSGDNNDKKIISGTFYMVKDTVVAGVPPGTSGSNWAGMATAPDDFLDLTSKVSASDLNDKDVATALATKKGWMVKMTDGEFGTSPATVISGYVFFGTFKPPLSTAKKEESTSSTSCGPTGGYGRMWGMGALDGKPLGDSAVTGTANGRALANVYGFGSNPVILGKPGTSKVVLGGPLLPNQQVALQNALRVYWYSVPEVNN